MRDDQRFGGSDPPAAAFFYSRDRGGEHPEQHLASYAGLMQADAYAGFSRLYDATRKPGPIVSPPRKDRRDGSRSRSRLQPCATCRA